MKGRIELEKILPMKEIRRLVTEIRGRAAFEIPPSGAYFEPIRATARSHAPGIGLGDMTLILTRVVDYFGPAAVGDECRDNVLRASTSVPAALSDSVSSSASSSLDEEASSPSHAKPSRGVKKAVSSSAGGSSRELYLVLLVTDSNFTYQVEEGLAEGAYADFFAYLESDDLMEELKKHLMDCSDLFFRRGWV